jgi:hypothetical protein
MNPFIASLIRLHGNSSVLDGRFTQVMVDAVNLVFTENFLIVFCPQQFLLPLRERMKVRGHQISFSATHALYFFGRST